MFKIWGILQNVFHKEKVDDQLCGHKLTQLTNNELTKHTTRT